MKQILLNPTAKQFFNLMTGYLMIACLVSFFITDFIVSLAMLVVSLIVILQIWHYIKQSFFPNKTAYFWLFPLLLFGLAYVEKTNSWYYKMPSSISAMPQLEAVIPTEDKSKHFLTLNHGKFYCGEHETVNCQKAYAFAGDTAKVWYQYYDSYNVIYQMEMNGQKIYKFDEQLKVFTAEKQRKNSKFMLVCILFLLPSSYFIWQNKKMKIYQNDKKN